MFIVCYPQIFHKHSLQFLLGVRIAPRETENNAYAKFSGDKQRALWYVMVFSGVVNRPNLHKSCTKMTSPCTSPCSSFASLNRLSPNGDQHQFSLNDIYTLLRDYVMRINKMITEEIIP